MILCTNFCLSPSHAMACWYLNAVKTGDQLEGGENETKTLVARSAQLPIQGGSSMIPS